MPLARIASFDDRSIFVKKQFFKKIARGEGLVFSGNSRVFFLPPSSSARYWVFLASFPGDPRISQEKLGFISRFVTALKFS
jgi:hypothetical protein